MTTPRCRNCDRKVELNASMCACGTVWPAFVPVGLHRPTLAARLLELALWVLYLGLLVTGGIAVLYLLRIVLSSP